MITAQQQAGWQERQVQALDIPDTGIAWLDRIRQQARADLPRQATLNRKLEEWRYTSADKLLKQVFASAPQRESLSEQALAAYGLPAWDGYRLVFHNGRYQRHMARLEGLPQGVLAGSLHASLSTDEALISRYLGQLAGHKGNLFTVLNSVAIQDGLFLHLGPDIQLDRPIQVIHITEGMGQAVINQPRHLVVLESGAKATLVEHFVGKPGDGCFHNNLAEIVVEENAELLHYRLQNEGDQASHLSSLYLRQQAASRYHGATLSFGGAWTRTDYQAEFTGEAAICDLSGMYTVGDGQHNDIHLDIQHAQPGCISREHFKGIAHGQGHAVFDGRILVAAGAQHTDAHLKNDNLMLSRKAMIDTKPQLEIYADDVVCSHGTTVGQLEPEQIFYLRSRGLSPDIAMRMLCEGFAGEIIDYIPLETVREQALTILNNILDTAQSGK